MKTGIICTVPDARPPTTTASKSRLGGGGSRPLWRRLVSAQESGLVLVIVLMMAALTLFGGHKPSSVSVEIPAGVEVVVEDGADEQKSVLTVKSPGRERRHVSDSPWRVRELDGGSRIAFGTTAVSKFLNKENLVLQTTAASYIAIMAVGMTAIIVLAGIDLSIGSIYALAALLGAEAINELGDGASTGAMVAVGAAVCGVAGAAMGFLNGFASVALRVHPFVITLGTMAIYRGIVFRLSEGQTISLASERMQTQFFKAEFAGVYPTPTLIMLAVAVAGMFGLSRTVIGRQIYAIGGNETAARYAGIAVGRVKVLVYAVSGALAGLSSLIYIGYFASAENAAGTGYELNVIAAAVIGGASLSGGRGSAIGAVLGAILVQLIDNGMVILDVDQSYNKIVMGAAIIVAVVVDQAKSKVMK